jgi:hypothetical protein
MKFKKTVYPSEQICRLFMKRNVRKYNLMCLISTCQGVTAAPSCIKIVLWKEVRNEFIIFTQMLYLLRKHFAISPDMMCSSRWLRAAESVPVDRIRLSPQVLRCVEICFTASAFSACVCVVWVGATVLRKCAKKLSSARLKLHITLLLLWQANAKSDKRRKKSRLQGI